MARTKWRTIEICCGPYTVRFAGHKQMPWVVSWFDVVQHKPISEEHHRLKDAKARVKRMLQKPHLYAGDGP